MKKLGNSMASYMIGVLFSLVPDQRSSEIEKAHRWSRTKLGVNFAAGRVLCWKGETGGWVGKEPR